MDTKRRKIIIHKLVKRPEGIQGLGRTINMIQGCTHHVSRCLTLPSRLLPKKGHLFRGKQNVPPNSPPGGCLLSSLHMAGINDDSPTTIKKRCQGCMIGAQKVNLERRYHGDTPYWVPHDKRGSHLRSV